MMILLLNKHRRTLAALVLTIMAGQAFCQIASRIDDEPESDTRGIESRLITLPPMPDMAKLLPFDVSATASQSFAIAPDTLTVGADGVIRYVLVALSASGVRNVSYEGMRCATLDTRHYAFGHSDGSWSRSRRDEWEPISGGTANRHYAALADGYLCDGRTIAGDAASIVKRLRAKQVLHRQFSQ